MLEVINSPVPVANTFEQLSQLNESEKPTETEKSTETASASSPKLMNSIEKKENLPQCNDAIKPVEASSNSPRVVHSTIDNLAQLKKRNISGDCETFGSNIS